MLRPVGADARQGQHGSAERSDGKVPVGAFASEFYPPVPPELHPLVFGDLLVPERGEHGKDWRKRRGRGERIAVGIAWASSGEGGGGGGTTAICACGMLGPSALFLERSGGDSQGRRAVSNGWGNAAVIDHARVTMKATEPSHALGATTRES